MLLGSMLRRCFRCLALGTVSLALYRTTAQTPVPSAGPQHAVLVELFTAEGCSSCPPADALLRQINGKHTEDGQLIVGLSEHVTYWNRLGWTDPFSSQVFTDRQSRYAERLRLDDVYTPQMVVNGNEQFVGGNGPALRDALHEELRTPAVSLEILSVQLAARSLTLRFHVGSLRTPLEINAVVADDVDRSQVTRGENAGQMLEHVAVARSLTRIALLRESGESQVQLPLSPQAPHGTNRRQHLVLFAQEPGTGRVFGSAVQALP